MQWKEVETIDNMKIITVANQKGGVGKTTTAFHLAYSGKHTLIIDLDPQCQLTTLFSGITPLMESMSLFDESTKVHYVDSLQIVLNSKPEDYNFDWHHKGKSRVDLADIFRANLAKFNADIAIIDSSPSFNTASLTALWVADLIILPFIPTESSLSSIKNMIAFIQRYKIKAPLLLLPTLYNSRRKVHKDFLTALGKHFPSDMIADPIPYNAEIEYCFSTKKPYLNKSRAGLAHKNLIAKVI